MSIAIETPSDLPQKNQRKPANARPRPRARKRWPAVLLTIAFSDALRVVKPSPYPHVWDEMPGRRSWLGEIVRDVAGLDPQDADYWIAVLLAMPHPMQVHFFSIRASRYRHAWFVVANADPSQAPDFLHARSLYRSERSRAARFEQNEVRPVLDGVSDDE